MTGADVYVLMHRAAVDLGRVAPGKIFLHDGIGCGDGTTKEDFHGRVSFEIGAAGLKNNPDELPDYEAMVPIVALFHEVCGHGGQLKYEFEQDTLLSRILALNHYACRSTGLYYDGNVPDGVFSDQYAHQPHEIAAQYMGLKSVRSYLLPIFDPDYVPKESHGPKNLIWDMFSKSDKKPQTKTDRMLLSYVNHRKSIESEFISRKKPYTDMDQVFHDFECAFRNCYDAHRNYDYTLDPYAPVAKQKRLRDDLLKRRISGLGLTESQARYAGQCESGMHQDLMLCAALRAEESPSRIFDKPVFQSLDLSFDAAFSPDMPDVLSRLPRSEKSPMEKLWNMAEASGRSVITANRSRDGPDGP